ncbi:Zinc ion binding nucleic acid binding protein [Quillaja saponaria]|uniref:Zinc ion binding nucleic acid binding protein n=1 Tax=Quillaja saponaria TaxID=32244 RepID=A0AAD7PFI1_QUISA|nr:Zinc ion binding nucleic acid binding protein [Quillaja saponaria]
MEVIDAGNDYFVVKLAGKEDREVVLNGGPIMDHFLTVQRWIPNFDPYGVHISKVRVWLRFPGLPLECYGRTFLWRLENKVGKAISIDKTTDEVTRGQFARMCVEVELGKSLISKYRFKGQIRKIEYEGMHQVCFSCGKYGHVIDQCMKGSNEPEANGEFTRCNTQNPGLVNIENGTSFGPWMIVQRNRRERKDKMKESDGGGGNMGGQLVARQRRNTVGGGSRFEVIASRKAEITHGDGAINGPEITEEQSMIKSNLRAPGDQFKRNHNNWHAKFVVHSVEANLLRKNKFNIGHNDQGTNIGGKVQSKENIDGINSSGPNYSLGPYSKNNGTFGNSNEKKPVTQCLLPPSEPPDSSNNLGGRSSRNEDVEMVPETQGYGTNDNDDMEANTVELVSKNSIDMAMIEASHQ